MNSTHDDPPAPRGRRSHLRGRYLLRSPWLAAYLSTTDRLLALGVTGRPHRTLETGIERILIAVGGHIGDAIIATSTMELLAGAFPNAEIGVLTPSWSAAIFRRHPAVRRLHVVDHWRLNRAPVATATKVARYVRSARTAVAEMRAAHYDVAFDLYPYYPNMAGVLWRAGIPRRAGFVTGGRGALYTVAAPWIDDRAHVAEQHARLVRRLIVDLAHATPLPYHVERPDAEDARRIRQVLAEHGLGDGYIVLHPGSGARKKDWPLEHWQELARRLIDDGRRIVLTGAGADEMAAASRIAAALPGCVNLCGAVDWSELTEVIHAADVVVCGDTSVAHLAAAMARPHVVLYSGINPIEEWRPLPPDGVPSALLTNPVPCAPCFRGDGCESMACVRGITVDRAIAAVDAMLPAR